LAAICARKKAEAATRINTIGNILRRIRNTSRRFRRESATQRAA
jgi:hypothetical protein